MAHKERCRECGFKKRGPNHDKGKHHKSCKRKMQTIRKADADESEAG